jgi:hypothetical protein
MPAMAWRSLWGGCGAASIDYKFIVLFAHTIRGAAGGSILNAELMIAQGMI